MNRSESQAETVALRIDRQVLREIHGIARAHGADECMGLLCSLPRETAISSAYLLAAETAPGHAETEPLAIKHGAEEIRASGQTPRGVFHSHGKLAVFHSAVDDTTMRRILPAMADSVVERFGGLTTPWTAEPGQAALPLPDGRVRVFRLTAGPVTCGAEVEWTGIRLERRETAEPAATHRVGELELAAGGIVMKLGVPEGASLTAIDSDTAPARVARLYSLVVNCAGEFDARCLELTEIGAETSVKFEPCEILPACDDEARPAGGRFLTARPCAGRHCA